MKTYYVYILQCSDNSYYTGVTNDIERRFIEHQSGDDINSYTFSRRPLKLLWFEYFSDINTAIEKEKQLKGWSRKKKEALINENYDLLVELSKNTIKKHFDKLSVTEEIMGCHPELVEGFKSPVIPKKIVITGPESTGKSTLTELLAKHYRAAWVKEYAREYLENLNKPYTIEDVLEMAKIQFQQEKNAEQKFTNQLFLDTDLTVFKVWLNEKYIQEIDWIEDEIKQSSNKIFFLCDIDIPWQSDPLREHPKLEDRQRIFNQYIEIMQQNKFNYHIISGDLNTRLKKCVEIVDNLI